MYRERIACKMALIGIKIKELQQYHELIEAYMYDDDFDVERLETIEDALLSLEDSALAIKSKASSTWLTAHGAKDKLLKEAKSNETV